MNSVLTFLSQNTARLGLDKYAVPADLKCVVATPRFKASAHLIFFVLRSGAQSPVLIAKVPRIAGDNARLDREAFNLSQMDSFRPHFSDSVPDLVANEDYAGHRLLIETAVPGQTMRPGFVRKNLPTCIDTTFTWLAQLHKLSTRETLATRGKFDELVQQPLGLLRKVLADSERDLDLIARTENLFPVDGRDKLPLVLHHGDFSSPNLLVNDTFQLGVVDWELAQPQGLPLLDMFFVTSYFAFCRQQAARADDCTSAFREAFFGKSAWARPHTRAHIAETQIPQAWAVPLFVLCWAGYVAGLAERLLMPGADTIGQNERRWLRSNRYYQIWQYAVEHVDALQLL